MDAPLPPTLQASWLLPRVRSYPDGDEAWVCGGLLVGGPKQPAGKDKGRDHGDQAPYYLVSPPGIFPRVPVPHDPIALSPRVSRPLPPREALGQGRLTWKSCFLLCPTGTYSTVSGWSTKQSGPHCSFGALCCLQSAFLLRHGSSRRADLHPPRAP